MKKNKVITIKKDDLEIPAELIYRKRKTMEIKIKPPNKVVVIAPIFLEENKVMDVLQDKHSWIKRKLDYYKTIDYKRQERSFVSGELYYYLGNEYLLSIQESKIEGCKDIILINKKDNSLYFEINKNIKLNLENKEKIQNELIKWFRKEAVRVINWRVDYYASIVGVNPINVKVKEQKKRWGSCTSTGNVLFNWKLIMAPIGVIDYVVVHELCHLIHMNHSKDFWKLVEAIMPDYINKKNWLKENGFRLYI